MYLINRIINHVTITPGMFYVIDHIDRRATNNLGPSTDSQYYPLYLFSFYRLSLSRTYRVPGNHQFSFYTMDLKS